VADSGYGDGHHFRAARERYGPFRLAILPIGAYEPRWFMGDQPYEARRQVGTRIRLAAPSCALGHHYGNDPAHRRAIRRALSAALHAARIEAGIDRRISAC
jgi:L-ascorbate metabolism protein UlaG (beta-lactamase superfamily)